MIKLRPLAALFILSVAACGGGSAATLRTPAGAGVAPLAFQAQDSVDVSVDWDAHPVSAAESSAAPRDAKVSLTASDGSGLKLVSMDARAVVYGPLAFTEMHLVFSNPEAVTREGTFSIALPPKAAISRFAMRLPQGWQEGEVVERESARAAYETFMRKSVDPALLEHDSGNVFRGRVFPIFAHQEKEIVISYTQTLARADEPYRMALRGLPALDQLDVQLYVPSANKAFVLHRGAGANASSGGGGYTPDRDFLIAPPKGSADAVRGGRFAVVRAPAAPTPAAAAAEPISDLAVLIDSSASRIETYEADIAKVARVVDALQPTSLKIACFDQEVEPVASFAEASKRRVAGATDLARGLEWLKSTGAKRALIVSDGTVTTTSSTKKGKSVAGLEQRIDAIAVGGAREDTSSLERIASNVIELGGDTAAMVASLRAPSKKASNRPALAFLEIDADKALPLPHGSKIDSAPAALVERAVAEEKVRQLEDERASAKGTITPERRQALAKEIVALSTRHRILTSLTAMLVLETDADYRRFNISRDAMRDIPVVGARGVEIVPRGGGHFVLPPSVTGVSPMMDAASKGAAADPKADSDRDGIPDMLDKCPEEPETFNGFDDDDGCPDRGQVLIESNNILILQAVHFRDGSAEILPESLPIIDAIAEVMIHHPEFNLVAIVGHTDAKGSPAANKELSLRRAKAVRAAVIKRGVEPIRLIAGGAGQAFPIDQESTEDSRARNRRVEFKILVASGQPTGVEIPGVPKDIFGDEWPKTLEGAGGTGRFPSSFMPSVIQRGKPAPHGDALSGKLADVMKMIDEKKTSDALRIADAWVKASPEDMLAWVAQGRALEALNRTREAARSFGSVLELASRPEQRRAAAGWLESLATRFAPAGDLAVAAYRRALEERAEQPSSHRLLAWSLARTGHLDEALEVTNAALAAPVSSAFDPRRFPTAVAVFKADAAMLSVALGKSKPSSTSSSASTTLALTWETDESDLDLEVKRVGADPAPTTTIKAAMDIRSGFGPEVITFGKETSPGVAAAAPSTLAIAAHQVRKGPQGFAFGKLAIIRQDEKGVLSFEDRPFVIMNEGAAVSLGTIPSPF